MVPSTFALITRPLALGRGCLHCRAFCPPRAEIYNLCINSPIPDRSIPGDHVNRPTTTEADGSNGPDYQSDLNHEGRIRLIAMGDRPLKIAV